MSQAIKKGRKRGTAKGSVESPNVRSLGEMMKQGTGPDGGKVPHGLDAMMHQTNHTTSDVRSVLLSKMRQGSK